MLRGSTTLGTGCTYISSDFTPSCTPSSKAHAGVKVERKRNGRFSKKGRQKSEGGSDGGFRVLTARQEQNHKARAKPQGKSKTTRQEQNHKARAKPQGKSKTTRQEQNQMGIKNKRKEQNQKRRTKPKGRRKTKRQEQSKKAIATQKSDS